MTDQTEFVWVKATKKDAGSGNWYETNDLVAVLTIQEAKDNLVKASQGGDISTEFFMEYKKLGGKKNRENYDKIIDIFTEHTCDIFTMGCMDKYETPKEALAGFMAATKCSKNECDRLFSSLDNVASYS